MNRYLVLIYAAGNTSSPLREDQKMAYYKKWGRYLASLSQDEKVISGSPLRKNNSLVSTEAESKTIASNLEGYMIVQAPNLEDLQTSLFQKAIDQSIKLQFQIHELDAYALIGV